MSSSSADQGFEDIICVVGSTCRRVSVDVEAFGQMCTSGQAIEHQDVIVQGVRDYDATVACYCDAGRCAKR